MNALKNKLLVSVLATAFMAFSANESSAEGLFDIDPAIVLTRIGIMACRKETDSAKRLDCFDRLAEALEKSAADNPANKS